MIQGSGFHTYNSATTGQREAERKIALLVILTRHRAGFLIFRERHGHRRGHPNRVFNIPIAIIHLRVKIRARGPNISYRLNNSLRASMAWPNSAQFPLFRASWAALNRFRTWFKSSSDALPSVPAGGGPFLSGDTVVETTG